MERFTTCKVELDLFDTTAVEDSKLTVDNVQPFADIENVRQKNSIKKVATLESDYFLLDGTFNFYDDIVNAIVLDVPENEGYMSNKFTSEINATFDNNHSSAGITFHFWEMVPKSIKITLKNKQPLISSITFYPTIDDCTKTTGNNLKEYTYFADIPAENYDSMNVVINGGDRFVRINYIEYGVQLLYGENDKRKLKTCKVTEEADVLSTELSINQSDVEIIDMDNLFKITNPSSYYKYLQQRQVFKITEVIDDEEVFIANHYLKEWSQENEHSATFKLQDIIGLMADSTFYGGLYTNKPAGELFDEIMADYGFTDYEIEDSIRNINLTGYLEVQSHREALQQVAFACGACVTTSRLTGIKIFKPNYETELMIDLDRKLLSNSKTTQEDLITEIDLTTHNYVLSDESKEVHKGDYEAGTYIITFSNPCTNLSITGGTILSSDVNYAQVKVDKEGEIVINGQEYEDRTFVKKYSEITRLPSATEVNVVEIEDATLISKSNARDIASLVYKIKQYRIKHECKIITQTEKPANMYALKVIDEYAPLLITKLETDLTGGFISSVEGIGYALKIQDYYRTGTELYAGEDGII